MSMPVRSLNTRVLKWPDRTSVDRAARSWARTIAESFSDVLQIACIGSYARGDWGVGSDLDLVVVVRSSLLPFHERARRFDTTDLPVPADVLVYTEDEWSVLTKSSFFQKLADAEATWVYRTCRHACSSDHFFKGASSPLAYSAEF